MPISAQASKRALLRDPAITVAEVSRRLDMGAATLYRHLPGGRGCGEAGAAAVRGCRERLPRLGSDLFSQRHVCCMAGRASLSLHGAPGSGRGLGREHARAPAVRLTTTGMELLGCAAERFVAGEVPTP